MGRFLEHSRIFHFANGGSDEIYIGSADWMPRNLFERCEVVYPVRDPAALERIHNEILPAYMADTVKARIQQPDGSYVRASKLAKDATTFSAQIFDATGRGEDRSGCDSRAGGEARHRAAKKSSECGGLMLGGNPRANGPKFPEVHGL